MDQSQDQQRTLFSRAVDALILGSLLGIAILSGFTLQDQREAERSIGAAKWRNETSNTIGRMETEIKALRATDGHPGK